MSLPRLLVLTARTSCAGSLLDTVATAIDSGARAVVLREKDLPDARRAALAEHLRGLLAPVDGVLISAGGVLPADEVHGADGAHLAARDRMPTPRPALVGRSCHDARELAAAAAEGCDYVTLSPVFATASKPGYGPALGRDGLASLVASMAGAPLTYALGGVRPDDVNACLDAGAYGVAAMGAVMRDPRIAAAYLAALGEEPA